MKRLFFAATAALLISTPACKSSTSSTAAKVGPLAPIVDVAQTLEKGINALVSGQAPLEKAFGTFSATARAGSVDKIKEAKAKKIILVGMEFELLFYKGDQGVYYLRTMVHPSEKGPAFLNFAGRPVTDGKFYVKGQPFEAYKDAAAGLGTAAKDFVLALKAGNCNAVPVADAEPLRKLMPEGSPMTDRMLKGLERSKQNLSSHCDAAKASGADRIDLRVDDIAFATLGEDGKINGMIRGSFGFKEGKVVVEIGNYRALKN